MIIARCDLRYDLVWREALGTERAIASVRAHFEPRTMGSELYKPVPFEASLPAQAVAAHAGDQLVLRFVVESADGTTAYQPNGQGEAVGRPTYLDLPGNGIF